MNRLIFISSFVVIIYVPILFGCGYTVIKEEPDPEYAIQDTLRFAADLIISNVINNSAPPLQGIGPISGPVIRPGHTEFIVTIKNIGNVNYSEEFVVFWEPFGLLSRTAICNAARKIIPVNGEMEVTIRDNTYYGDRKAFEFLIVTNPKIRHELRCTFSTDPYFIPDERNRVPISRELNYKNNDFTLITNE
jgi:hypothetical protein